MNKVGKCSICGKEDRLTFEHIPPRSANNNIETRVLTGNSFIKLVTSSDRLPWDYDGLEYEILQKGNGLYSLCESCNNITGAYYGNEYVKIAKSIASFFVNNKDKFVKAGGASIKIDFYPQRFIKQVLSMFCSTTVGLNERYPVIKDLLLEKEMMLNDYDFKVSLFYLKTEKYGYSGPICSCSKKFGVRMFSELDLFPFGFVFDYDKNIDDDSMVDITSFLSYKYDEKDTMTIIAPIYERVMPFSLDFRSKEQFLNTLSKNNIK